MSSTILFHCGIGSAPLGWEILNVGTTLGLMSYQTVALKAAMVLLVALFFGLQYRLWVGEGSLTEIFRLRQEISVWQQNNVRLAQRNAILAAEVHDLKTGFAAVEERARAGLGMIQFDETFIYVVE